MSRHSVGSELEEEITILKAEHEAEWCYTKLNFCVNNTVQETELYGPVHTR